MYNDKFSYENLLNVYNTAKKGKLSTGRDRINKATFSKRHTEILEKVSDKLIDGTFKPISYKEVLIIKNKTSNPRCLSIPCIRDNIVLDVLKNKLNDSYDAILSVKKVPDVIDVISHILKDGEYNSYIKLDISRYYDEINHDLLIKALYNLKIDSRYISLIDLYIKTPTYSDFDSKNSKSHNTQGIPQGIAISNVLGNIYLNEFDKVFSSDTNIKYIRYVDDILIFCNEENIECYKEYIIKELKKYELALNEEKIASGLIDEFTFLGYFFHSNGTVSIAEKNIKRIELSLEKIFSDYLSSNDKRIKGNIELLKWKVNFKITGCFKNGKRYGWVIFFCQNENETILHELDWLVKKLCYRFNLEDKLISNNQFLGKKFVKTHKEFYSKKDNADYIPNIDSFSQDTKKSILINVCKRKSSWVESLNDYLLDREFDRFIFKSIKDIEHDLYQIYT